eukprot:TRINITY_DN4468_c0_g1_i1.p1 TRINITY_DN4468_c0_g1~~TRINITY_DN4468_c0_g1_i1.p1  ORF type:complete len:491 (+),score=134.46 TRINITY_DN4468_c0_g1_i1:77-1549(+)
MRARRCLAAVCGGASAGGFAAAQQCCEAQQNRAAHSSARNVAVIGAGHVGICTAWYLSQKGFTVTVVERCRDTAEETSNINGGLLVPSLGQPWNSVSTLRAALRSLFPGGPQGVRVHLRAVLDPHSLLWLMWFARCCTPGSVEWSYAASTRLSAYSMQCLEQLPVPDADYRRTARGTLSLFPSVAARDRALRDAATGMAAVPEVAGAVRAVEAAELPQLEPLLGLLPALPAGAVLGSGDSSGDIGAFARSLEKRCREAGVRFRHSTDVAEILTSGERHPRVKGLRLRPRGAPEETLSFDHVVVAAGNGADRFAAACGDRVMSLPVKGYALELPTEPSFPPLLHNVVDDNAKVYAGPLRSPDGTVRVRVSGCVEIGGRHGYMEHALAASLAAAARAFFPAGYFGPESEKEGPPAGAVWHTCSRPQTPDDLPVVGPSPSVDGVWYNVGHGHLGWTRGAGAAALLAALMAGEDTPVPVDPYLPGRFGRRLLWG